MATAADPTRRIALVVDDEPGVRMCTADVLIDMGCEVVEADSGEDALRRLDTGLTPVLLVTDHLMPGMSGSELAREVTARHPQTAVIVVSGYTNMDLDPGLLLLGKPFRLNDLRSTVQAAMTSRG